MQRPIKIVAIAAFVSLFGCGGSPATRVEPAPRMAASPEEQAPADMGPREQTADEQVNHAVGITIDRLEQTGDEDLVMIDPWPGVTGGALDRGTVPTGIELAHRDRGSHALVYFWAGWS